MKTVWQELKAMGFTEDSDLLEVLCAHHTLSVGRPLTDEEVGTTSFRALQFVWTFAARANDVTVEEVFNGKFPSLVEDLFVGMVHQKYPGSLRQFDRKFSRLIRQKLGRPAVGHNAQRFLDLTTEGLWELGKWGDLRNLEMKAVGDFEGAVIHPLLQYVEEGESHINEMEKGGCHV